MRRRGRSCCWAPGRSGTCRLPPPRRSGALRPSPACRRPRQRGGSALAAAAARRRRRPAAHRGLRGDGERRRGGGGPRRPGGRAGVGCRAAAAEAATGRRPGAAADPGGAGLGAGSPGPTAPGAGSGGAAAAGPFLYRQPVTQEQEGFADGFVKALADLHKQNQLLTAAAALRAGTLLHRPPGATGSPRRCRRRPSGRLHQLERLQPRGAAEPLGQRLPSASAPPPPPGLAFGAAGLGSGRLPPARSLEEPQTVPEAPPSAGGEGGSSAPTPPSLSPLDAESQERLKAERKRLRNRIAASKCRRRKLERIARLEEKVKALKGQNAELAATANLLRAQVTQLQGRVRSHLSSGCHINAAGHPPPPPHAAAQPRETPPEAAAAAPETSAC
ncbi:LOW QUALITY PROTEIN: transcription factor jun-D-like [Camarhynchus parvulus]|uniref:LOW QUALITY PROTEIN: transcription factor jun-D-like n=1 Tax=Geospiza parvula TaxID=87175 RepID=UPI0012382B0D|nr:LOW QUALITY PROTEIN: transcription factor jun-D-like [Camarhynchus parvulus]